MKRTILVVEDEFMIANLLQFTLDPEFKLINAYDGKEALEKINPRIDLIVLDLMIPKIDGFTVLSEIKKQSGIKNIPIIVLSAKHQKTDIDTAIELGADEYITKPFEPEFLLSRIKTLLNIKNKELRTKGKMLEYAGSLNFIQQVVKN